MPTFTQHWVVGWALSACFEDPDVVEGILWGNVVPDVDIYVCFLLVLTGKEAAAIQFHRSATHSAWVLLGLAWMAQHNLFWRGVSYGFMLHVYMDVFFWFWFVDFLWPLQHWVAWASPLNLWKHVNARDVETFGFLLELVDDLCLAGFLGFQGFYWLPVVCLVAIPTLIWIRWAFGVRILFACTHAFFMFFQFPLFVWVMYHYHHSPCSNFRNCSVSDRMA